MASANGGSPSWTCSAINIGTPRYATVEWIHLSVSYSCRCDLCDLSICSYDSYLVCYILFKHLWTPLMVCATSADLVKDCWSIHAYVILYCTLRLIIQHYWTSSLCRCTCWFFNLWHKMYFCIRALFVSTIWEGYERTNNLHTKRKCVCSLVSEHKTLAVVNVDQARALSSRTSRLWRGARRARG